MITILAFGNIAEVTGKTKWETVRMDDTDKLMLQLTASFPRLNDMSFRISVNRSIISENTVLNDQDIVALLPPFSGG